MYQQPLYTLWISVLGLAPIILLSGNWDSWLLHFAMSNQLSVFFWQLSVSPTNTHTHCGRLVCLHINVGSLRDLGADKGKMRRAWQPTPVFSPAESPWTEEPSGLQSIGSQRVRHNWATKHKGKICVHEEAIAYNKLYLGDILTGLHGCGVGGW